MQLNRADFRAKKERAWHAFSWRQEKPWQINGLSRGLRGGGERESGRRGSWHGTLCSWGGADNLGSGVA